MFKMSRYSRNAMLATTCNRLADVVLLMEERGLPDRPLFTFGTVPLSSNLSRTFVSVTRVGGGGVPN
jgi:hypothetical protein